MRSKAQPRNDLKAEITRRGLKVKTVAERVGVTRTYFSGLLSGKFPISERMGRDISLATGIPLAVVLPGAEREGAAV